MSARALQRVAVRMLYDADFVERVYADVEAATDGCDLVAAERGWLVEPDRRAWRVDPLRRSRSLAALVEEFAVGVALFVRADDEATSRLDAFFSSEEFHRGMQEGRSLAAIFTGWFAARAPHPDLVLLEGALARVRRDFEAGRVRAPGPAPVDDAMRLASGVAVLEVAEGTVRGFGEVLAALRGGSVAGRALDRSVELPTVVPGPGREGVLVDGRRADPRLEVLSPELARILALVDDAAGFGELAARAAPLGADRDDLAAIVESFAEDGILQPDPGQEKPSNRPPW